jgi:hypothetical protein
MNPPVSSRAGARAGNPLRVRDRPAMGGISNWSFSAELCRNPPGQARAVIVPHAHARQCRQRSTLKTPSLTQAQCVSFLGGAGKVGTSIGAGLIVVVWVVVDFLLALSYGIYRLARR